MGVAGNSSAQYPEATSLHDGKEGPWGNCVVGKFLGQARKVEPGILWSASTLFFQVGRFGQMRKPYCRWRTSPCRDKRWEFKDQRKLGRVEFKEPGTEDGDPTSQSMKGELAESRR